MGKTVVKLSDVIKVWDRVHQINTGDLGFSEFNNAIEEVFGIADDTQERPSIPYDLKPGDIVQGDILEIISNRVPDFAQPDNLVCVINTNSEGVLVKDRVGHDCLIDWKGIREVVRKTEFRNEFPPIQP